MKKATVDEKALVVRKALDQALDSRGRLQTKYYPKALDQGDGSNNREASQVVDLGHWLKVMVGEYREEQSHRRAAIRLMFSTAGSTALMAMAGEGGGGGGGDATEKAGGGQDSNVDVSEGGGRGRGTSLDKGQLSAVLMDVAQLCSMMRTLNATVCTHDMVALYRDAFEHGDGHVDIDSFLRAAESRQFFSSCLRLPTCLGSEFQSDMPLSQCADIGAVVNFHYTVFKPKMEAIHATLPSVVQDRLGRSLRELQVALSESANGLEIDGRRPLCAYRRVLDLLLHVRMLERERQGESVSARRGGVKRAKAVVRGIETELTHLEAILRSGEGDTKLTVELLRTKLCAVRVQRTWRRKLLGLLMPSSLRGYMGPHYGNGKSGVKHRKFVHSLEWTLRAVDTFLFERLHVLNLEAGGSDGSSHSKLSTAEFCYVSSLQWIGNRALSEVFVHDFFANLRNFMLRHPRIRLFALFCGIVATGEKQEIGTAGGGFPSSHDDEALFWGDITDRTRSVPNYVSLFASTPHAEKFLLQAVQVLRQNPMPAPVLTSEGAPVTDEDLQRAAPRQFLPVQKSGFVPNTLIPAGQETKTLFSWVEVGHAKRVLQYMLYHGGLHPHDVEKAVARVSLLATKPGCYDQTMIGGTGLAEKDDVGVKIVKTDSILYILVDEWRKETERR